MRPIAGDFWGLRLHLAATVHALPIGWAPAGAKADEREVFEDILGQLPPDLAARVLALTTVVWHNDPIGAPVLRSLTAYDTEPQIGPCINHLGAAYMLGWVRLATGTTSRSRPAQRPGSGHGWRDHSRHDKGSPHQPIRIRHPITRPG